MSWWWHHRLCNQGIVMKNIRNRTIAFAGIFQASALVQQLAWTGKFAHKDAIISIESLLAIDASSIRDIYKNLVALQYGLETLLRVIEAKNKQPRDQEIARYVLALIHLERCLIKRNDLLSVIQKGILKVQAQVEHFPITHDNIMANLAGIYTDTLSTFAFRIHIAGEQNYLSNTNNTNKIRTLLLAGIRAAVLWRQMGGNRWQLLFSRKDIINDAKMLIGEIKNGA